MVSEEARSQCAADGPHIKGNAKSVTFHLPAACPVRGPLDRSTRSAGDADAAAEPCEAWKLALCRRASLDAGLGLGSVFSSTPQGPGSRSACPGCSTRVSDGAADDDVPAGLLACDNSRWKWSGEPSFCCLCASLKGLGRLKHFGCDHCKARRTNFYEKPRWFLMNSECKHCFRPRAEHLNSDLHAFPRCPPAGGQKIALGYAVASLSRTSIASWCKPFLYAFPRCSPRRKAHCRVCTELK